MTVYFINEGLGTSNSGIEHAEFDRARLFRRNQVDFKIVTSNYIPNLHSILPLFAISDNESMNMFDYFQGALNIPKQSVSVDMVDFGMDAELERSGNTYLAMIHGHILGRIKVNDADDVTSVEYFDGIGNLYKVIMFDVRGFASLVQYYSPDNKVEVETWLNTDGIPVIEKTYTLNRNGNTAEIWKMGTRLFNNIQELRLYFYNQLNESGKNMFIMDRANVSEWQLTQLDKPAYKVFMLHNHQSSDAQNPNAALLNDNYEWTLANIDEWDAIVSATPQQTHDVQNRWGRGHKCYTVPVGVIPDIEFMDEHIPMNQRKPHSMLVTARIAPEKGIDTMIEALAIARKTVPDATLDVFGYVDHGNDNLAMRRITDALELLDDKDAVTLHGHSKDVHSLHEQYQIYLIFSQMEGFNLALMEAQSAGMVGITNDVYYGPNELIKDGINGYIVGYTDVDAFAQKIIELCQDEDKLQNMSDNAYHLSERYSEANVWTAWQQVFDDFDNWSRS